MFTVSSPDTAGGDKTERACALTGAIPPGPTWGLESATDGTTPNSRWPAGAALVTGSLGRGGSPAPGSFPVAVEPNPSVITRGSVFWLSSGARTGDGPLFGVALADHPHLGVSRTVWGDVVEEDLVFLDALAEVSTLGGAQHQHRAFPLALELEEL